LTRHGFVSFSFAWLWKISCGHPGFYLSGKCNLLLLHFLAYLLAGLQKVTTDKEKLLEGAHKLKQVAAMVYACHEQNGDSRQLAIVVVALT
jgi:hypothetical protein